MARADEDQAFGALALLLATSGVLLAGAFAFQHLGGLQPCEMCLWQRWGHVAVLGAGLAAWALRSRPLAGVAAVSLVVAGALGAFHAGVERGWWDGPAACSSALDLSQGSGALMGSLLATPLARCDEIPWAFAGVSMAGWNALVSIAAGLAALVLLLKGRHVPASRPA